MMSEYNLAELEGKPSTTEEDREGRGGGGGELGEQIRNHCFGECMCGGEESIGKKEEFDMTPTPPQRIGNQVHSMCDMYTYGQDRILAPFSGFV